MYKRRVRHTTLGIALVLSCVGVMTHLGFIAMESKWPPASSILSSGSKRLYRDNFSVHPPWGIVGKPQMRFRDNFLANSSYITSWAGAGITNQFITYVSYDNCTKSDTNSRQVNMIYLGTLSNRIPVIPPFIPTGHIVRNAEVFLFGDVFDLAYLQKHLRMPVLDWKDVKLIRSNGRAEVEEELGCWTTAEESQSGARRSTRIEEHLGLDVSYLKVPREARMLSTALASEIHVTFPHLAALVYPQQPNVPAEDSKTADKYPSPKGYIHPTDAHLACFDSLYYATSGVKPFEWQRTWGPAWRFVGRHLPFTRHIQELAQSYIMRSFGLTQASHSVVPTFIAVHIRRRDFLWSCERLLGPVKCSPPLSVYGHYVEEVKKELQGRLNITISHILGITDDTSESFIARIQSEGWSHVNHTQERTVDRYGRWYPPLIDAAILSMAVGLVGTKHSTVSLLGGKRVQDWNNGAYREVDIRSDWSTLATKQP